MQQVGAGGVGGVDIVVDDAGGVDRGVDPSGDEVDGFGSAELGRRDGGQCGGRGDGVGSPVRDSVQRAHAFGDRVTGFARGVDDFVELQVQVPEVGADKIPVGLFALQVQFDEIDEYLLQVLRQVGRGVELPHIIVG